MNIRYIQEPSLQFGDGQHLCPKSGIFSYGPYDVNELARPDKINIGIIGKSDSIDIVLEWLNDCKTHIKGKEGKNGATPHPNLFLNFSGFNKRSGFKSEIVYDESYIRKINNSDFSEIIESNVDLENRIKLIADLYLSEIKFLTKNKRPDVILCVLSDNFITLVQDSKKIDEDGDESVMESLDIDQEVIVKKEQNFRRYLKARAMQYNVPIQMLRDKIAKPSGGMQDPATIAWNFFTAIYYKASGTPWALIRKDTSDSTCYAGISFYKSRDATTTQTSIAQIFNEVGKGVILRGEEIKVDKKDRSPHMSEEQAYNLLSISLKEYFNSVKVYPRRLVLHKSSNFTPDEIYGFKQAAKQVNIYQVDLVTIMPSKLRLYRGGEYAPLRGTHLKISQDRHLLYTRGSVPYFETYTGMYIPSPVEIRLFEHDESPNIICDEILALTKMNWNNTQFDRKFPITLECARNVGEILKYLEPEDTMQLKYSFYM